MRKPLHFVQVMVLAALAAMIGPGPIRADVYQIQVGTVDNTGVWSVGLSDTGPWYAPFQGCAPSTTCPPNNAIGITQGFSVPGGPGTAIPGLDPATWDGIWYAESRFYVPSWAVDPHLYINSANVDDKAMVVLNSWIVGEFAVAGQTGPGTFSPFAGTTWDVTYDPSLNYHWGWDKELPGMVGGWFDLLVVMNNTGSFDLSADPSTFGGGWDNTYLSLDATFTYATPEPAAWALLFTAGGVLAWRVKRCC